MPDFTLLYCYHPFRRLNARGESIAAIDAIERHFGGHVARVACATDTAYSEAVRAHWSDPGDLIICEQDMGPLPEMIEDLLSCQHPACTQPYWLSPASTGFSWPIISVSTRQDGGDLQPGEVLAGRSAIGLVRLSARQRQATQPPPVDFYGNVEHGINVAVGWRWHVHWPTVTHYHGFKMEDYARDREFLRHHYALRATGPRAAANPAGADQPGGSRADARTAR